MNNRPPAPRFRPGRERKKWVKENIMSSAIERLIDASVKCVKCGAKGRGTCDCWDKCKHGLRKDAKCACTVKCSCGWFTEDHVPCGNPKTTSCTTRVWWGKYNRKTKKYE